MVCSSLRVAPETLQTGHFYVRSPRPLPFLFFGVRQSFESHSPSFGCATVPLFVRDGLHLLAVPSYCYDYVPRGLRTCSMAHQACFAPDLRAGTAPGAGAHFLSETMAESRAELLISPLATQQRIFVRLFKFWERRCVLLSRSLGTTRMMFSRIEVDKT
jgi:hypothetical protein